MSRTRSLGLAALAVLVTACTSADAPTLTIGFRQPAALAVFHGYTLEDPANVRPYLAVANASRNDVTLVDATDDKAVMAPIQLRAVVLPVPDRPALLASASLGDGGPDLLVAVSAGDSWLQVVTTWDPSNVVVADAAPAVDLGADVVGLVAVPSPPGTARIAAALADRRIAIAEWTRGAGGAVELVPTTPTATLDFQPLSLAALPDDPDVAGVQTELYAATLDEIVPGSGLRGVAALPPDLSSVRALDARGPTRLVAAARLRERADAADALGPEAFAGQPRVDRVYAVLDESGCGLTRRIDCGVVTLDPVAGAIPPDWAGWMPYRAPIRVAARPIALAVAPPPALPPADAEALLGCTAGAPGCAYMRLVAGTLSYATTAVGAVASDDGTVQFLDLGRFKLATTFSPLSTRTTGNAVAPSVVVDGTSAHLWLVDREGETVAFPDTPAAAAETLTVTPGYTRDDTWTVSWQGVLPGLSGRRAEAGRHASDALWLALQSGEGAPAPGRTVTGVVRLHHPALGVRAGDLAVVGRAGISGGCAPASTAEPQEFEATIAEVLAPAPEYPGGAVLLERPAGEGVELTCYQALLAEADTADGATALTASIRAGGLVLAGAATGYAGRPVLGTEYALEYPGAGQPDEDELALACPLADWDGSLEAVPACDPGPCDRDVCEQLVLARKARRFHHLSESCALELGDVAQQACIERWPGLTFPAANGPLLALEVEVRTEGCAAPPCAGAPPPARGMSLTVNPQARISPLATGAAGIGSRANGAVVFDRSTIDPASGYRFFVSYPAGIVVDASPSVTPVSKVEIR